MLFSDCVELGVVPIAATKAFEPMSLLTPEQWNAIEDVPIGTQQSEHLLTLKLDLILSGNPAMGRVALVSPQLPVELYRPSKWKERFFAVAKTLGRESEAANLMEHYSLHADRVRRRLGGRSIRISILMPQPDGFRLLNGESFAWSVLREAGVDCCQPIPSGKINWLRDQSWESLRSADADIIFIEPSWNDRPREGLDGDPLVVLQHQPLWPTLHAVQNHRAFAVHDYWRNGGAVAADHILADFERYALSE